MNGSLKRLLPPLAALLLTGLAACGGANDGRQAPDFSLSGPDGRLVSLSSRKGRTVLVNFWATWCDSCKEELPALNDVHRAHAADPFEILAVNVEEDAAVKAPPFIAQHKIAFPVLYADGKILDAYAIRGLPASYLIDPEGTIIRRYLGPINARKLENDILSTLNLKRRTQ